jgi:hypothetical protein
VDWGRYIESVRYTMEVMRFEVNNQTKRSP